jgi:hypothetical protein
MSRRGSGEGSVSVRRSALYEREMPLHRINERSDYDAAVALNGPPPRPTTPWLRSGGITGRWWTGRRRRGAWPSAPDFTTFYGRQSVEKVTLERRFCWTVAPTKVPEVR